jgi:hypothetical protein
VGGAAPDEGPDGAVGFTRSVSVSERGNHCCCPR